MRNTELWESLSRKVPKDIPIKRYTLPEMISESYKVLYSCTKESNLYRLAEEHLVDLRNNPNEVDRLSVQLSKLKEAVRLIESDEMSDTDLSCKSKTNLLKSKSTNKVEKEELSESDELTDEELEELAKHLDSIRNSKKMSECDTNNTTEVESKSHHIRRKEILTEESDECTEEEEEKATSISEVKDPSPELQDLIMTKLADTIYDLGVEPNDLGELLDDLVYNIAKMMMPEKDKDLEEASKSKEVSKSDSIDETLQNGKVDSREAEVLDLVFSYLRDMYNDSEFATLCKEKFSMTAEELESFCAINEGKIVKDATSWDKVGISEFAKKSSSKAFVKTFKKLDSKLHEGAALTRQESISLYKAANSAMTHLSVELEHNPEFLSTFNEATTLLTSDVNKILESMKKDKAPSKKTMKSLAKFSEAILTESEEEELVGYDLKGMTTPPKVGEDFRVGPNVGKCVKIENGKAYMSKKALFEAEEDEELPPVEDEEIVGDDEGDITSEESEEFDQEYADARVELHKELMDEHGDTEDIEVQNKISQDAEEVESLPGITDEQIAELDDLHSEAPDEEEVPDEEAPQEEAPQEEAPQEESSSDEITDDELSELKRHLTEMRKNKNLIR